MRIETALKVRDRGVAALRDLYSHGAHFGLLSSDMESRRRESFERIGVNKAPQWVRSFLDGYWRSTIDRAYGHKGDFVYGAIIDGVFYSTHNDRADYYEKHGIGAQEFGTLPITTRGHYWRESIDRGEPKPFFTSRD